MEASWRKENHNLVVAVKTQGAKNPYFAQTAQRPDLTEIVASKERELKEMKSLGYAPLTAEQRFELAGEADRYRGVYSHLCAHAHNGLNALEERHLAVTPEGPQLTCFKPLSKEVAAKYLCEMGLLVASSVELAAQTVTRQPPQLEELSRALADFLALWPAD